MQKFVSCVSNIFFKQHDKNLNNDTAKNSSSSSSSNSNITENTSEQNYEYKKFDLDGIEGNFYVESVYDADTITLIVPTKLEIYNIIGKTQIDTSTNLNKTNTIYLSKIKVRLMGIDTPEIKPKKNISNREEHITKAKNARDFLSNLILNKVIRVKFLHNDLYGRPLVYLYQEQICLNDLLVKKGFAKKYDGGTKDTNF